MTTNQTHPYHAMLAELEKDLAPIERQWNELLTAINVIRAKVGLPPRPGSGIGVQLGQSDPHGSPSASGQIRSDAYVGKRLRSAMKEYLETRKAQGLDGPATPREIYDAIMAGGFEFEAKDETTRLISLRNTLRKRSEDFKKFEGTGKYGLVSWYGPYVKKSKAASDATVEEQEEEIEEDDTGDEQIKSAESPAITVPVYEKIKRRL